MKYIIFVTLMTVTQYAFTQIEVQYRKCTKGCGATLLNDDFEYETTATTFKTEDVISDYGVRKVGKGSRFHQAIDYTVFGNDANGVKIQDLGYALVAIQGGDVMNINPNGSKYITIGNYKYTHIFKHGEFKTGKFLLRRVSPKTGEKLEERPWAIIDLGNCRAFCEESGRTVEITGLDSKFCGSTTFTTIKRVEAGWDIAPLGDSGFPNSTHLHLERNEGRKHDPNQVIQHVTQPFDISLKSNNNQNDIAIKYPGTAKNAIRLRATMRGGKTAGKESYTNVTMNLDKAELLLHRGHSTKTEYIVGFEGTEKNKTKIESKFWLGAHLSSGIYPSNWNHRDFGSWTRTGTYPYSHNDSNIQIYDDYFFADFYTRVDKDNKNNLVDIPTNTRYPDGLYFVTPRVTNVLGEVYELSKRPFKLDNFKPYLQKFDVKLDNKRIYELERKGNENGETFDNGYVTNAEFNTPLENPVFGLKSIDFTVTTSEPLTTLTFAFKKESTAGQNAYSPHASLTKSGTNDLVWTGSFSDFATVDDCYVLEFKGADLSDNLILDVFDNTDENGASKQFKIPTRKSDTEWYNDNANNTGKDYIKFCLKDCSSNLTTDRSGTRSPSEICEELENITDKVTYIHCKEAMIDVDGENLSKTAFTIKWKDQDGNELPQYDGLWTFNVTEAGTYCYTIESEEFCCKLEGCVFVIQELMDDSSMDIEEEISNTCHTPSTNVSIDLDIFGNEPYTVEWYTNNTLIQKEDNVISGSGKEDLLMKAAGQYKVIIKDANGCEVTKEYAIEVEEISLESEEFSDCSGSSEISVYPNGGKEPYLYKWSTGATDDFIFDIPNGTYTVTVTDARGCSTSETFNIDISPLSITATPPPICQEGTGEISPTVTGGTQPYTFAWSTGATTQNISGLSAGTFTITVTDGNGCSGVESFEVESEFTGEISGIVYPACGNDDNGRITLTDVGTSTGAVFNVDWYKKLPPYFPFQYVHIKSVIKSWKNNSKNNLVNIPAGIYIVVITDHWGCQKSKAFELKQSDIDLDLLNTYDCQKSSTYNIKGIVNSNHDIVKYEWYYKSSKSSSWSLSEGTNNSDEITVPIPNSFPFRKLRVIDNDGLCSEKEAEISEVKVEIENPQYICTGDESITLIPKVVGGSNPYFFEWNTGETTESITVNQPGTYTISVTDRLNCNISKEIEVKPWAESGLTLDFKPFGDGVNSGTSRKPQDCKCDGRLQVFGNAFVDKLPNNIPHHSDRAQQFFSNQLKWQKLDSNEELNLSHTAPAIYDLCEGHYRVSTKNTICPIVKEIYLPSIPCSTRIELKEIKNTCSCLNNGCFGFIEIDVINPPNTLGNFKWFKDGVFFSDKQNLANLCTGTYKVEYYFSVQEAPLIAEFNIIDDCGDNIASEIDVLDIKNISECGRSDGMLHVGIKYDQSPVTYSWSNGATEAKITNLAEGDYTVTISSSCFIATKTFQICRCVDCISNFGDVQVTYPASCNGLYGSHNSNVSFLHYTSINASTASSNDGALIYDKTRNSINSNSIRFNWSGPNGFVSDKINLYNLFPGKYKLKIFNGCKEEERTYYVTSSESCADLKLDLSLEDCTANGEPQVAVIIANIAGGSTNKEISFFTRKVDSPQFVMGINTINQVVRERVFDEGEVKVVLFDKETGCKVTKFITVKKLGKPLRLATVNANTFRGCEEYYGDNTITFVRLNIIEGNGPYRLVWHDGLVETYHQQIFNNNESGALTLQRSFQLDRNVPLNWSATVTDACGNKATVDGIFSCNQGVDEDGNEIPCDMSGFNIGKWKGFGAGDPDGCFQRKNWNPFRYYAAIRAELTDLNKTFTVFWPDGTESHLGGKKHFDWEVPEKGLYSVRIQDGNGCFEIVQFDYTYECDTRSIFDFIGEGNPDNPNCPNISNIKVDGQSGSNFNVSFDLNNVSEDVSFKATFNLFTHSTNTIGASIFAGEVSLTKGKNVLTIPMSVMNQNKDADAFLAKIKLMDFLECPNTLDFVFEINGVSRCPDMQVFHNGNEGTVEIFSPSDINNCKLKITGLSDVTINLEKNKTFTHEFNTSSTGIVSIALELPSSSNCSRLSKQITINNDCDNNTLAIQQGLVTDILILDVYSSIPVIFDAKFNKSNGGSVNVPNSTNLNVSGSRRFEFDVKNLPIGGYKLELHYKNPNCPTKSINFTKESSCPYYIISDDYDPSSRKFVLTYTNRTNTVVNGKYEIRKDGKIVTEQNYILKTNVSGERFIIDGSNLNLEPGRYTVSWYTNPTLQCGGVRRFVFNISGLISEDPPESFKSCDDRIVNIMFDSYLNDYIIFWRPSNNDSLLLSYTHNSEVGLDGNKILNTFTKDTTKNIKSVLIDDDKNQYVINTDSSTINIKKLNVFSAKVWERTLLNKRYISETSKGNEFLDILVFDNIKQEYILLLIDRDGNIKEKTLDIPRQPYFIMKNVTNGIVTGRYDLGVLKMSLYDLSGNRKDLNLDKNIKPIDIKSINSESIAVGAEFKGDIEVNDNKYSSGEFNNTIYLNLNNDLKINKIIYNPKNINQFITSFDTDGLNSILVAGKSKVFYSAMEIDSCIYIEELFWEDNCPPFTSILEAAHCHLLWSPAPQGYSTTLQYFKDGVWMDEQRLMSAGNGFASLGSITSPYTIVRDGKYRLKHSHRDCPDVLSNEVVTSCHANCSCTPPILGYDAEDCWLEWNVSPCSSYNVALERFDNNIWTTVMAHATSPFYLQTMGQYRLRLTQPGCSEITTSPVTTQCTPSQDTCICTAPSLLHNPAECTLSWSVSGCDGYTTQLQRWVSGVWVSLNVSSPYNIPALSNGNYRIHQSKDGCEDVVSATVNVTCSCTSPAQLTVFDDSDGFMGINPQISRGQTILHYVSSGAADACDRSHAQLAFLSSVVDDQWSIGGNGMGVLPYGVVGSYYLVDIYLPSDMTSGYGDIYMTHPCGDSYMLRIVYDCAPPCTSIDISVSGNTTNSCENITISPTNGVAPYTYDVSGTGNMGTGINYTGSNATINLSTLDDGEGITLNIVVTDAYGCSGTMQQLYTRCANTCYGESCSTTPPGCNQGHIFSSSSGYNHDAIVYFTVPNGVTDLNIKMDPLTISQSLQVDKNNNPTYINIESIRTRIQISSGRDSCTSGYHIHAYPNNEAIGATGCVRNSYNYRDFVSCPLSVNSGDLLAIDINHPICAEASSWYLAIECNGSSSMQSDNNDEHRMSHEEGITDMMYFIEIESEKISSNVKSSTDESSIRFYPNPFSQGINLEMVSQTQETVTLQAINSLGAVVFEKKVDVLAGINVRYLEDFETVPSGVYAVRVLSSSGDRIFRVIRLE